MEMKIVLDKDALMPVRAHETDAGLDLLSPIDINIPVMGSVTINTGVHVQLPKGTYGRIASKSGLNVKFGIVSEGVIDEGYTGSIRVKLYNHGGRVYMVKRGDKITQMIVEPYIVPELKVVSSLEETERGDGGFGSTGR